MTPRKPLAELKPDEIPDAIDIRVDELNRLLKLAAAEGYYVHADVFDRADEDGGHPEVKVDCR